MRVDERTEDDPAPIDPNLIVGHRSMIASGPNARDGLYGTLGPWRIRGATVTDLGVGDAPLASGTLVARKPPVGGFRSSFYLVEPRGLEPLTPTLPVWCATSCATAPRAYQRQALAQ